MNETKEEWKTYFKNMGQWGETVPRLWSWLCDKDPRDRRIYKSKGFERNLI